MSSDKPGWFDAARLDLVVAFARAAAGAIANALDFQRERRVAHALTRGFVPGPAPSLPGLQIGLVYEPAGHEAGGGDIFGAWTMPSGASAVLVGDVSGKGLEVAALSSMVRFFVEARTWDAESPAEVLAQTAALLRHRLPSASFVSAFMGVIDGGRLRYANAGHGSTFLLPATGGELPLAATGLPLASTTAGGARRISRSRSATSCSPPPTGSPRRAATGAFFGAARLPALLAEHGAPARPGGARRARAPRGRGVGARARRRRRDPRGAPVLELRAEPADGARVPGAVGRVHGARRVAAAGASGRPRRSSPRPRRSPARARPGSSATRAARGLLRRAAAPCRRTASARSSACSCPPRPRAGAATAGALLAELERRAAARGYTRVRLFTTEVLVEAQALYAADRLPRRRHDPRRRPDRHLAREAAAGDTPAAARPLQCPFHRGRVAQWESARFTRERSQVRNPPRPSSESPANRRFSWLCESRRSRPRNIAVGPLGQSLMGDAAAGWTATMTMDPRAQLKLEHGERIQAQFAKTSSHTLASNVHRRGLTASHPRQHVATLGRWGQERPYDRQRAPTTDGGSTPMSRRSSCASWPTAGRRPCRPRTRPSCSPTSPASRSCPNAWRAAVAREPRSSHRRSIATFGALLDVADSNGGDLLKHGGDALLLLFEGEGHVARACDSAIGMRRALREVGPAAHVGGRR